MTKDRIAELRALLADEELKYRRHKMEPGRDSWVQHQDAEYALQQAAVEHLPALLDCAEALAEIVGCPQGVDEATIPAGGVDVCPEQVVVNMSVGLVRLRRAQAALAKLNGEEEK